MDIDAKLWSSCLIFSWPLPFLFGSEKGARLPVRWSRIWSWKMPCSRLHAIASLVIVAVVCLLCQCVSFFLDGPRSTVSSCAFFKSSACQHEVVGPAQHADAHREKMSSIFIPLVFMSSSSSSWLSAEKTHGSTCFFSFFFYTYMHHMRIYEDRETVPSINQHQVEKLPSVGGEICETSTPPSNERLPAHHQPVQHTRNSFLKEGIKFNKKNRWELEKKTGRLVNILRIASWLWHLSKDQMLNVKFFFFFPFSRQRSEILSCQKQENGRWWFFRLENFFFYKMRLASPYGNCQSQLKKSFLFDVTPTALLRELWCKSW